MLVVTGRGRMASFGAAHLTFGGCRAWRPIAMVLRQIGVGRVNGRKTEHHRGGGPSTKDHVMLVHSAKTSKSPTGASNHGQPIGDVLFTRELYFHFSEFRKTKHIPTTLQDNTHLSDTIPPPQDYKDGARVF